LQSSISRRASKRGVSSTPERILATACLIKTGRLQEARRLLY
jgi:hypothetical protein